ncbi:MAG: DUF1501 domain-containing protein [Bacteroidetes bacterium]|nr:DUF1501 domain-containing protein [Bacteroidota bacterium]
MAYGKKRYGSALEHGLAHEQEHRLWSRRNFLTASGLLGAGGMLMGNLPLRAFHASPLLASLAGNSDNDRILVLIRLDGGNDGINTIIPRGNNFYYNLRPTIGIPDQKMWHLSPEFGMYQESINLQPMWENGQMKVIHNVGYPEPNYSHFRSYDIIASGSKSDVVWNTGWIGRFLDNEYAAFLEAPPTVPPALQIGVQSNLVFKADQVNMALAVSSPQEFYQIAQTGQLYDTSTLGNSPREIELNFLRQTANSAFRYAQTIKDAYGRGKNQVDYPTDNYLAEQLAIVARLIKGNLGTRVYMVEIGGFDTHANQLNAHTLLIKHLADAVKYFFDDLTLGNNGVEKKVLGMSFSEFGRTIYENASQGTDHGWGTPVMLFGGNAGNGFVGNFQDLSNPDPYSDPSFSVDFRSVYASIMQEWLGANPEVVNYVLQDEIPLINGLTPQAVMSMGDNDKTVLLGHQPSKSTPGAIEIKYAMLQDGPLRLQIMDEAGHSLRTLESSYKAKGSYTFVFEPAAWFLSPGKYQYRIQSGGKVYQRSINW